MPFQRRHTVNRLVSCNLSAASHGRRPLHHIVAPVKPDDHTFILRSCHTLPIERPRTETSFAPGQCVRTSELTVEIAVLLKCNSYDLGVSIFSQRLGHCLTCVVNSCKLICLILSACYLLVKNCWYLTAQSRFELGSARTVRWLFEFAAATP